MQGKNKIRSNKKIVRGKRRKNQRENQWPRDLDKETTIVIESNKGLGCGDNWNSRIKRKPQELVFRNDLNENYLAFILGKKWGL